LRIKEVNCYQPKFVPIYQSKSTFIFGRRANLYLTSQHVEGVGTA
jgi:hypothetical protein